MQNDDLPHFGHYGGEEQEVFANFLCYRSYHLRRHDRICVEVKSGSEKINSVKKASNAAAEVKRSKKRRSVYKSLGVKKFVNVCGGQEVREHGREGQKVREILLLSKTYINA